jgi:hypothetical protein
VKLENQRPFVQPRDYNEGDSEAVEATSYALLVLLDKDGVTTTTDKIVQWLSTMRMTDCGLISMTVSNITSCHQLKSIVFIHLFVILNLVNPRFLLS